MNAEMDHEEPLDVISSLPLELFRAIFDNVSLQDKLKCRAVCKAWQLRIGHVLADLKVLFASPRSKIFAKFCLAYYHLDANVLDKNFIKISKFSPANAGLNFKRLLSLTISQFKAQSGSLSGETLNSFDQLKELTFYDVDQPQDMHLSLPNLKRINFVWCQFSKVTLDTPQLKHLQYIAYERFQCDFTFVRESVEHVQLSTYHPCFDQLKGVKVLFIDYLDDDRVNRPFLLGLKNLQKLHIKRLLSLNDASRELLISLGEQKKRFERSDLQIYCNGMRFASGQFEGRPLDRVTDEFLPFAELLQTYNENLPRLANQFSLREIDYSEVERIYPSISNEIWSKFGLLKVITISNRIADEAQFIEFLGKFNGWTTLALNQLPSEHLLSRLSAICPSLEDLLIEYNENDPTETIPIESLAFAFKFKSLVCLEVDKIELTPEFVRQAYAELNRLCWFQFRYRNDDLLIISNQPGYELMILPMKNYWRQLTWPRVLPRECHHFNQLNSLLEFIASYKK